MVSKTEENNKSISYVDLSLANVLYFIYLLLIFIFIFIWIMNLDFTELFYPFFQVPAKRGEWVWERVTSQLYEGLHIKTKRT